MLSIDGLRRGNCVPEGLSVGAIADGDRFSGSVSFAAGFEKVLETGIRASGWHKVKMFG
jgi:hypothetical protein